MGGGGDSDSGTGRASSAAHAAHGRAVRLQHR